MEIVEVGPRDGLQNEKRVLPTAVKIAYVERAIAAGLRRIEVAAFARPDRVPQMADAAEVLRAAPRPEGVRYTALVLNGRGLDRALALEEAARPDEINYVVVASDEFSRRNQGMSTADSLAAFREVAARAREAGLFVTLTVAAAFGCPFTGPVPVSRVRDLVADAGPVDEICLADTIGVGVPPQVTELAGAVRPVAPGVPLRAHFHNTRNAGYANATAAVASGFGALDASLGGIGGCPFAPAATGNIATEDLAYLLNRSGLATGVDVTSAAGAGAWIGEQLGLAAVPAQLGRAGDFPGDHLLR
ncbi:putative hydroxymethylglutaryl-CoA lyase [Actinoplanes missouriensis 431]|uniref:Putative hydroxymethylglutaryl-CoA lyase n=1 Tax=Actinoplanes missouriensis (strain ATCC 14538 / DSM 43046 / CBS 188.64 / JCM 3121 / NBRC 102363 / NCIMB 12654 / NRRL B-3342 / UNCC 431) TaxID=512565 RepID=I0HD82_ACTM4|nr:hydroxymethylglutaryl-CoA lyase [Actinoplanes missouriensis]BAL90969.1 putative hydroxymethylglutaryl-CoA lyase [Actinoplanes missouriensis 431]